MHHHANDKAVVGHQHRRTGPARLAQETEGASGPLAFCLPKHIATKRPLECFCTERKIFWSGPVCGSPYPVRRIPLLTTWPRLRSGSLFWSNKNFSSKSVLKHLIPVTSLQQACG